MGIRDVIDVLILSKGKMGDIFRTTTYMLLSLGQIAFFTSCATTEEMTVTTWQPAEVNFPKEIKRIGILDRSNKNPQMQINFEVDKLLLVEKKWLHNKGTAEAIEGLRWELQTDERFESVVILPHMSLPDHGQDSLPTPLSWGTIDHLCRKNGLDAIFSLAYYKTNSTVSSRKVEVIERGLLRNRIRVRGSELTLETLIKNGWRIYDAVGHGIIDEHTMEQTLTSKAKGSGPYVALQVIANRKDSVLLRNRGYGTVMGHRLLPREERQRRYFHVRGTPQFVLAKKALDMGNIEKAMTLWEGEAFHQDMGIRARACHNLAVFNEHMGKMPEAIYWATKSHAYEPSSAKGDYIANLMGQKGLRQERSQGEAAIHPILMADTSFP